VQAVPRLASYILAFALQLRKKHGKTSVRVVEKCPDIPVEVVQYTFTHKRYKEQHNDTERYNVTIRVSFNWKYYCHRYFIVPRFEEGIWV
jgi:hypothetical protein